MANFKYAGFLTLDKGAEFDRLHEPNSEAPFSGVYRCDGCGISATFLRGQKIPVQPQHKHNGSQGKVRWRLVVKSHYSK